MPFAQDLLRPYARLATTNRLMLYGALSTLAVSLVILNAFKSYSNFYSVAVHLSRSSRSVLVLANFGVLGALLVGRGFQRVLFGSLRPTEVERLYDRIWFFLTESLLAFTIFRDEFDVSFAVMFGFLLFVKCFHWLMSFRIEWMDQIQYPGPNIWFHIRMYVLFMFLWIIDTVMLCIAIESILTNGIGGVVLFASEYAILMASALNSVCKYFIIFYDHRRAAARGGENAPVWEDKSMYIFYVELATDFLKLVTYLTFFLLVLTFYGLPLNIVRDVYMTARSFINRCRDLIRYRTATRNMDERYPNATQEELTQMNDRTCIICREEMVYRDQGIQNVAERAQAGVNDTPKKLPCGHVFHFHCLRSWLERQQSCPTCRRTVLDTRPIRPNPGEQAQLQGAQPPQPGAVPQMQGFPGQQQRPQVPGFLARWLGGPAAAPPIVPGQFAPGPGVFNPAQFPQQGFPQQQGFPGQPPFWQQQPGYYVPAQQGPPPVQVLQGFYIGNQWQPWGAPIPPQFRPPQYRPAGQVPGQALTAPNPAAAAPQMQRNAPSTAPAATPRPPDTTPPLTAPPGQFTPSMHSAQTLEAQNVPIRPAAPSRTASASATVPSPVNPPDNSDASGLGPAPREVAALAALRRMNSTPRSPAATVPPTVTTPATTNSLPNPAPSSSFGNSQPESPVPCPPVGVNPPTLPPNSGANLSQPTNAASASTTTTPLPTPVPQGPSPQNPSSAPQNPPTRGPGLPQAYANGFAAGVSRALAGRPPVPSLIPLFDPAMTSATIVPPPLGRPPQQPPTYAHHSNNHPPSFNQQQQPRPRPPRLADTYPLVAELLRGGTSNPELRSLPQTLTEDQLNRLDTITRESIDERLRVLENVQGAVWRCVEELVRVRSALPPRREGTSISRASTNQSPAPNASLSTSGSTSTSSDKGKAREEAPTQEMPGSTAGPSTLDSTNPVTSAAGLDPEAQIVEEVTPAVVTEVVENVLEPAQ